MERYICEEFNDLVQKVNAICVEDDKTQTLRFDSVGDAQLSSFIPFIKQHAYKKGVKKLSVKVSDAQAIYFLQHGFKVEASILAYYGLQDAIFLVYFLEEDQVQLNDKQHHILDKALAKQATNCEFLSQDEIVITAKTDTTENPIEKEQPIVFSGRMEVDDNGDVMLFNATVDDEIVATAEAQYNQEDNAVEFSKFMTDPAVDIPVVIGALMNYMQFHYKERGCETAFTIVSANSLLINSVCAENQFDFGGTLKNELLIDGKLSHLNTWFKRL